MRNPVFDDTTCRRVSSVLAIWGPHGREIQFFDETTCRMVSSFWVVLRLSEHTFRVSDDTMCRRVSSVLGGSRPHGRGIRVSDDTICRMVSSPEALIGHWPPVTHR